ncbi:MAG: hypothetical protein ACRDHU_15345 [Actinomycetota bacterium]
MILALSLVLGAGCSSDGEGERSASAAPTTTVAGVELYPIPTAVAKACRALYERASTPILCPGQLPRPSRDSASRAPPPETYSVSGISGHDVAAATGQSDSPTGVNISYSAETSNPRMDRPERFLHFDVQTRDAQQDELPPDTRPASLGGKRGELAAASSRNYADEPYFANHVRFFWTEGDTRYAATLHNFGPGTRAVLGALVADLRPANQLPADPPTVSEGVDVFTVPVSAPVAVAVEGQSVWVAGRGGFGNRRDPDAVRGASLAELAAETGEAVEEPIRISRLLGPSALAVDDELWVAFFAFGRNDALFRLQPGERRLTPFEAAGPELTGVSLARGAVWALDRGGWPRDRHYRGGVVQRIDPTGERVVVRVRVGRSPAGIAAGEGSVWATNNLDDTVSRIDPTRNRVTATITVGGGPTGVAVGYGAIWVANHDEGTVSRIDPRTDRVTETVSVGRGPRGVATGAGSVWVTNNLDDTVSRIDPGADAVTETIQVAAGPSGIATGDDAIWVASTHDRAVSRIEP